MSVPLTASLYVPGTLDDADKVLADIRTGYFVEKTMDEGRNYCERKINFVKSNFDLLNEENPHTNLKEFHMICLSMKPQGVTEDQIKLPVFHFLLADFARERLFYLPSDSVNTWSNMSRLLFDRLLRMKMKIIDVSNRGAPVVMTPQRIRELISAMATNSQQFRPTIEPTRRVRGLSTL
ncbi:hypothetical protein Gohar_017628 [Gossypium harknessii]|uniref:Uncharacterized protein n=1 Tax=Gossypium harknessii TaxID=34285 RepID=A0A7J9G6K3_9ROSI|nr:hypothetical protein [Gossypium harknessii]